MTYNVGIAGGSGSGKGTIAELIQAHLVLWGLKVHTLSTDDCYRDLSYLSQEKRDVCCFDPDKNFDHPSMLDFDRLTAYVENLKSGRAFEIPRYDFKVHTYGSEKIDVPPRLDVAIVEGIYALYSGPEVGRRILNQLDYSLFVATDPQIAQNRRILRDVRERGRALDHVIKQLNTTVIPMQKKFVDPSALNARDMVNWRADETNEPEVVKAELVRIARQRAMFIYEQATGKSLLLELDPGEVEITGLG